ncbi:unnamed protein product [Protopolystoma xenopodis]|uniref:Coiled-coil domain-containing protein 72 homolog n=1 Tax=Protopolystoma xenopodis TaxID=117903 RepID=A0A3S5CDL8_9PLAT|nr:unnamed protein product [Protopolystoma xenopodis]
MSVDYRRTLFPYKAMPGREGGKKKPLKQPKKEDKFIDESDVALKLRMREEQKKLEDFKKVASTRGPIGSGSKKVSKK